VTKARLGPALKTENRNPRSISFVSLDSGLSTKDASLDGDKSDCGCRTPSVDVCEARKLVTSQYKEKESRKIWVLCFSFRVFVRKVARDLDVTPYSVLDFQLPTLNIVRRSFRVWR
jgi:hypothetical protein